MSGLEIVEIFQEELEEVAEKKDFLDNFHRLLLPQPNANLNLIVYKDGLESGKTDQKYSNY